MRQDWILWCYQEWFRSNTVAKECAAALPIIYCSMPDADRNCPETATCHSVQMPLTECVLFTLFPSILFQLRSYGANVFLTSHGHVIDRGRIWLTDMFPVHVVIEAKAVCRRVGDPVRIFRCHVEGGAQQTGLVAFFTGSGGLDIHIETCQWHEKPQFTNWHHIVRNRSSGSVPGAVKHRCNHMHHQTTPI